MSLFAASDAVRWVHYLPIATTVLAVFFCTALVRHRLEKGTGAHLTWWAIGVGCYGAGTLLESWITLGGNSVALTKAWYVAGALLGAYPLAQGTVFLLVERRKANVLTAVTLPIAVVLAVLVVLSPADVDALEVHRPSGDVLAWTWVRAYTPILNLYAVVFLVGGAIQSSLRYWRTRTESARAVGNALIAVGAILPAIGGGMAKAGVVEALYVAELVGLLLIWAGYRACSR